MRARAVFAGCLLVLACEPPLHVYPLEASSSGAGGSLATVVGHGVVVSVGAGGASSSCGFGEPANFTLPSGYLGPSEAEPFNSVQGGPSCADGATVPSYGLADLDGDGKVDLVFTSQCAHAEVGVSVWWWFRNTGAGFATTAALWPLPDGFSGSVAPFPAFSGELDCADGADAPAFALLDMTSDGRPDLLVTRACNTTVGTNEWWMFENTGAGFATTPTMLALPGGFGSSPPPFPASSGSLSCSNGANAPTFVLADMNGDDAADLLVTQTCAGGDIGSSTWSVYLGGASGFSGAPRSWALPAGFSGPAPVFANVSGSLSCASGANAPAFNVLDVNGDGVLDLLVTQTCDNPAVGVTEWLLYPGGAEGFASTPVSLSLPSGYSSTGTPVFAQIQGLMTCGTEANTPTFGLVDMNGDGRLDMLVTQTCNDTAIGASSWLIYEGDASGFAAPTVASLPSGYEAASGVSTPPFAGPQGSLSCSSGADEPGFTLIDLNGDYRPDIVVTARCDDTETGAIRWLVDASSCH